MSQALRATSGATVLHIERALTVYQYIHLEKKLRAALHDAGTLQVDLSQVTEIDSTGVQLLVMAKRWAQPRHCQIALLNPSPVAREFLHLCGLDHFFGLPRAEPVRQLRRVAHG